MIRRLTSLFRQSLTLVVEIITFLTFFGLGSFTDLIINFNQLSLKNQVLLVFFLAFVIVIIIWKLIQYVGIINNNLQKILIDEDLSRISSRKDIKDLHNALPKTTTLNRLFKRVKERIKKWDNSSVIVSCNLFLKYENHSWQIPHLQLRVVSDWNNETGWFYEGGMQSEDFEEGARYNSEEDYLERAVFFVNPKWNELVIKAYQSVVNKLTDNCRIALQGKHLTINYYSGNVKHTVKFELNSDFTKITKLARK